MHVPERSGRARIPGVTARCGLEAGSQRSASPPPRPRRAAPIACAAFRGTSPLRSALPRAAIGLAASPLFLRGSLLALRRVLVSSLPSLASQFILFFSFIVFSACAARCGRRAENLNPPSAALCVAVAYLEGLLHPCAPARCSHFTCSAALRGSRAALTVRVARCATPNVDGCGDPPSGLGVAFGVSIICGCCRGSGGTI